MPSNKPKVQILLSDLYYKKFKKICEIQRRSESKMGEIMIETFIEDFEKNYGAVTEEDNKEIQAMHRHHIY